MGVRRVRFTVAAAALALAAVLLWHIPVGQRGLVGRVHADGSAPSAARQHVAWLGDHLTRSGETVTSLEDEADFRPDGASPINVIRPGTLGPGADLELPILMYHHIRDYRNPRDPVGEKLSVSPRYFAAQLDEIRRLGFTTITFQDLAAGHLPAKPIIITLDDGYRDCYTAAFPELLQRRMKAVAFVISGDIGAPDYMTADEIKEIAAAGMEIGAHTVTHPDLAAEKLDAQKAQIFSSKQQLEDLLGIDVISFCYPYGRFTPETVQLVAAAGYSFAVTTRSGEADTENRLLMRRIRMPSEPNVEHLLRRLAAATGTATAQAATAQAATAPLTPRPTTPKQGNERPHDVR